MSLTKIFVNFTLIGAEWVLWLLVILSVISVAIMVQKVRELKKNGNSFPELFQSVSAFLLRGEYSHALSSVRKIQGAEARITASGLEQWEKGALSVEETMKSRRVIERASLERGLAFLGTMGNNAPFIGLFGTVLGIIRAFHDLSMSQEAGPGVVMAGISEALVATAVGLLVAIPAVIAYNYFQRRVRGIMNNSEVIERSILAFLQGKERK